MKKRKKINLYQHKGLPIAVLLLVFLVLFLLVAFSATQEPQTYTSRASETSDQVYEIDSVIQDIDTTLRGASVLSTENLSDLE